MSRDPFAFASVNARTVVAADQARVFLCARLEVGDADRAVDGNTDGLFWARYSRVGRERTRAVR